MDTDPPLDQPQLQPHISQMHRYEGEERRRPGGEAWLGIDRRVMDPPTEQDHPEEFGPN